MLSLRSFSTRFVQLSVVMKRPICTKRSRSEMVRDVPRTFFPARSWLSSSKTRHGFVKASQAKADVVVLDLEDSVPKDSKDKMLYEYVKALKDGVFEGVRVFVRLCQIEDYDDVVKQIDQLTIPGVCGYVLPKIDFTSSVTAYEKMVKEAEKNNGMPLGSMKFVPVLESSRGFLNADQIIQASGRNVGVTAGTADFMADSQCDESSSTLDVFLSQVVMTCRAANILPIAGICEKIDDHISSETFYRRMKAFGFAGAVTLSPFQTTQANIHFSYSPKELTWAEEVMSKDVIGLVQPSVQESRQLIGPPHKAKASVICQQNKIFQDMSQQSVQPRLLTGRTPSRGVQGIVKVGHSFRSPLEITVTESWKALWESAFFTVNRLATSAEFSSKLGLKCVPLPFTLINTLTLALTVTSFSESARVHLGCYDAVQKRPVYPGDTVSGEYRVDDASPVQIRGGGCCTIVRSSHHLVNQHDQTVFTLQKRTMFPPLKIEKNEQNSNNAIPNVNGSFWRQFVISRPTALLSPRTAQPSLSTGELIIHSDSKCFGLSETRMLCKLFKITNPHHHNVIRYSPTDILVPGLFVISAMVSNAEYDVGQVVYEEYPMHTNINRVNPGDQISTLTLVVSVRQLDENPELEEITLKHIGVKNVDLEWLLKSGVPEELFSDEIEKPAHYEKICAAHCPLLYRKIACQAVRRIIRVSESA